MSISKLILGTVQFGMPYGINNSTGKPSAASVSEILNLAWSNNVRELDCADAYGDSQKSIGDHIKETGQQFRINTKFRIDAKHPIECQLKDTLNSLGLSEVNVYFFHRFQETIAHPKALDELNTLKASGRIRKAGVSIYTNEEFKACIYNDAVDVIQLPFNLLDNHSKRGDLIQLAKQHSKTLQVRSVFLQGLFFKERSSWPSYLEPLSGYVEQLRSISNRYNMDMHDLALNYALSNPSIDNVIIGVDSAEQLQKNIAIKQEIDIEIMQQVDAINVEEQELLYPMNWK